jgi:CCR4-NOT transcription complex subunit 4
MSFQNFRNNLNVFPNASFPYYYQTFNNKNYCFQIQNNNFINDLQNLQNVRIIQKNLVYLIGLSKSLISLDNKLKNYEYLGQYGNIEKFVINKLKTYNSTNPNGPSYSCHITFSNSSESSLCILALDNMIIDNHIIKASYGTTKYCLNYLKNNVCHNKYCLYLHERANKNDLISREEMNNNKSLFEHQHILAINLSGILEKDFKEKIKNNLENKNTIFPNILSIFNKDFVKEYLKQYRTKEINEILKDDKNKNENNIGSEKKKKKKTYITISTLNKIFCSKTQSRFPFVLERDPANNSKIKDNIDVPIKIQNFINNNIRNLLLNDKEKEVNNYLNYELNYKDDSWLNLENKLKIYNINKNKNINIYGENESFVVVDKFYTY